MRYANTLILIGLICMSKGLIAQNQAPNWGWPVVTDHLPNHRGKVVGTPGEYRSPYFTGAGQPAFNPFPGQNTFTVGAGQPPRYHGGVDITSPDNPGCGNAHTEVYHIGGTADVHYVDRPDDFNDRVLIDNTIYWHTILRADWVNVPNQQGAFNDEIGDMDVGGAHVHIMPRFYNAQNYLLALPGYTDNSALTINQNSIHFYPNGVNQNTTQNDLNTQELTFNAPIQGQNYRLLYGQIDAEVNITETRTEPNGNAPTGGCPVGDMAPNILGYQIIGIDNNVTYTQVNSIDFTNSPTYESAVQTLRSENVVNDYSTYFATNSTFAPYDRYWNTIHRTGVPESHPAPGTAQFNAQNALSSMNALYPDGRYRFRLFAYDADNGSAQNNLGSHLYLVTLDNFRPHVTEVTVRANGDLLKKAKWEVQNNALVKKEQEGSTGWVYLDPPTVRVEVKVSEPVNQYTIVLKNANNAVIPHTATGSFSSTHFWAEYATTSAGVFENEVEYKIYVSGQDYFGNPLVRLSEVPTPAIPRRTATGWTHTTLENEDLYKFKFKGVCSVSGGFAGDSPNNSFGSSVTCDCEPLASFTATPVPGGNTMSFDASGSTGTEPLSYAWSFGDGTSGTGMTPTHLYSEGGEYIVILTIEDPCDNTDTDTLWVNVIEGNSSSLYVEIVGPGQALPYQEVTFNAIVSGGASPYHYCWEALNGDPYPLPEPPGVYECGLHKDQQQIRFEEPTGIGTATVYVTVTDAAGQQSIVPHSIDIREDVLELDFEHFPDNPSGLSASDRIELNQYLFWVAAVDPLLETPYPADYTWDFGDGTVITEPNGQVEHSFTTNSPTGTYTVKLTMCDALGSCISKNKVYYVGDAAQAPPGYVILPENTVSTYWGDATQAVTLTNTTGSLCWGQNNANVRWTLHWVDCDYQAANTAGFGASFNVNEQFFVDVSDPNYIRPWGCLSVVANDYWNYPNGHCGGAINNCVVFMQPSNLTVSGVSVQTSGNCTYKLAASVSGGGWQLTTFNNPNSPKIYKEYKWMAYDIDDPDVEIAILSDANTLSPTINAQHEYFSKFPAGQPATFIAKVQVTDFAGQVAEASDVVAFDPFRVTLEDTYTRCPDSWSYFENTPLAAGGSGQYNFTWTVTQPSGGALDFQSGDSHDPFPYFKAPASGNKVYNLNVQLLDGSGNPTSCQISKPVTVTADDLYFIMDAQAGACITNSMTTLGPSEPENLGGSGHYGFEWSTANPSHLAYLSDIFSANPIVQGIPGGQTITYTLKVTDLFSECSATRSVTVTGYDNDVILDMPAAVSICYGEEYYILGSASPNWNGWPPLAVNPYLYFGWTTDHPRPDYLLPTLGNPGITLTEHASSYPGTYTFTVRATRSLSGCYAEADVEVTVGNNWSHVGYQPLVKSAVVGTNVPLWDGNNNYITSGVSLSQILVGWQPFSPNNITYYNNTPLPRNGMFVPTVAAPYLTMTVWHENSGCHKTYRSNRYILSDSSPELGITAENAIVCNGAGGCFDVTFDAHLANYQTSLLPPYISVTYTFELTQAGFQNQLPPKTGQLTLTLENSTGLYKGQICEYDYFTFTHGNFYVYDYRLTVTLNAPHTSIWGNMNAKFDFNASESEAAWDDFQGCHMGNGIQSYKYSYIALGLLPCNSTTWQVSNTEVASREKIDIFPDGNLEIVPGDEFGIRLMINPCILPGLEPVEPEQKSVAEATALPDITPDPGNLSLDIFPNPFTGLVSLRYVLEAEQPANVRLDVMDFTGKLIQHIHRQENSPPGQYQIDYDGSALPPGVYLYQLVVESRGRITKKAVKVGF